MGVVDVVMVGHFQGTALAAVALGNLYFFGTVIFGWGVIMGLDPIIAQAVGANDDLGVSRGLQRGLMLAVALTILSTAVVLPVETVLRWLGQPPDVVRRRQPDYVHRAVIQGVSESRSDNATTILSPE